ncbi:MAG: Asp-tRNA(Asn)/Glu-tRNA(Gln) amidotransferase subunit GatC [Patescibacteria group bacterium]
MKKNDKLTVEEILHLANLAKLTLTKDEVEAYRSQLGETIQYIKNLDELDTANIKPTNSVVDLKNITFEDGEENCDGLSQSEAFANAHDKKNSSFVVKRIL